MKSTRSSRRGATRVVAATLMMLVAAITSSAQTFTTLLNFNEGDGADPQYMSMVQGTDGNLYGSTILGGNLSCDAPYGCGTLFKVTPTGTLSTLYTFCAQANCADGAYPSGLVLGTDENFYGTTYFGGASPSCSGGCGTVFRITRDGVLTTLYSFGSADGAYPYAALVEANDGNFYGTTSQGGSGCSQVGCGTVFKITPAGRLTTLHSFDATDGYLPFAALIQASDGSLYGTTFSGGGGNCRCGTVFKITPSGKLTTLHSFDFTDGQSPNSSLLQAVDGSFYGTTLEGGHVAFEGCSTGCGTVFRIKSDGTFSTTIQFRFSNGGFPAAPLIQATDGNFYGTAGYVFKLIPEQEMTLLGGPAGNGGIVQATNGTFYGTSTGGLWGLYDGTVFSLSVGLGPFVTTLPTSRKIGQRVIILGNSLTGTTSVTFNGTAATFTVVSSTEIATTVPAGATTGTVKVITPSRTLTSNVVFRVR